MSKSILLFGGTGRTGLYVAQEAQQRGMSCTAMVREGKDLGPLEATGATIVTGTPIEAADVENAFASDSFDAIISTLGHRRGEPPPRADVLGIEYIIAAAKQHNVSRMIMVTMIGAGDSVAVVSDMVKQYLGEPMKAKTAAEEMLKASGLDYTILRPGGLNGDPDAGSGIMTTDMQMGVIAAGDLGRLTVDCVDDASTIGHTYYTIDPEIKEEAPLQRGDDSRHKKHAAK